MGELRKLPEQYSVTGYDYRMVKRGNKGVIYHCKKIDSFEVFMIKVAKETTVMGNRVPERERVPSNESFGTWAWCTSYENKAEQLFQEIETGERPRQVNIKLTEEPIYS